MEVDDSVPLEELGGEPRQFQLLVQSVRDYAIYMLDTNGVIRSWNAGGERIKGYTADEIIGHNFSKFYPPEDVTNGVPRQSLETAKTEGKYEAEGWRLRKDGSRFRASVVIDPIFQSGVLSGLQKLPVTSPSAIKRRTSSSKPSGSLSSPRRLKPLAN